MAEPFIEGCVCGHGTVRHWIGKYVIPFTCRCGRLLPTYSSARK